MRRSSWRGSSMSRRVIYRNVDPLYMDRHRFYRFRVPQSTETELILNRTKPDDEVSDASILSAATISVVLAMDSGCDDRDDDDE